jgi:hypothetical protein
MSNISGPDRIDDVAPGDIVAVDGEGQFKVVFKDANADGFLVTFESDDGATFDKQYAAGTEVTRALESKWESDQSPTDHT